MDGRTAKEVVVVRSNAETVDGYLAELPDDRRKAIEMVRKVILKNLPAGYEEAMEWGMITYQVPLDVYPDTYNGKPLMYAALANQKNHMAVYLTAIYMDDESRLRFERDYAATGKRMDLGKSCVRFRRIDELPLKLIGAAIALMPMEEFVEGVKQAHSARSP